MDQINFLIYTSNFVEHSFALSAIDPIWLRKLRIEALDKKPGYLTGPKFDTVRKRLLSKSEAQLAPN